MALEADNKNNFYLQNLKNYVDIPGTILTMDVINEMGIDLTTAIDYFRPKGTKPRMITTFSALPEDKRTEETTVYGYLLVAEKKLLEYKTRMQKPSPSV